MRDLSKHYGLMRDLRDTYGQNPWRASSARTMGKRHPNAVQIVGRPPRWTAVPEAPTATVGLMTQVRGVLLGYTAVGTLLASFNTAAAICTLTVGAATAAGAYGVDRSRARRDRAAQPASSAHPWRLAYEQRPHARLLPSPAPEQFAVSVEHSDPDRVRVALVQFCVRDGQLRGQIVTQTDCANDTVEIVDRATALADTAKNSELASWQAHTDRLAAQRTADALAAVRDHQAAESRAEIAGTITEARRALQRS